MYIGTKNGETRLGPFSNRARQLSSNVCSPPVPVPMITPTRFRSTLSQFAIGAGEQAVTDACLASNWDKVDLKRVGVIIGTGTGGLQTFEDNLRALFGEGAGPG